MRSLIRLAAVAVVTGLFAAPAAHATTVTYAFDGSSVNPAFTATISVDAVGGQGLSGTGSINFNGNIFDLTLITLATPGGNYGGTVGYRDNHGTDIFGGNTAIPIDPNGLIFAISNNPVVGQDAIFSVWDNGGGTFEFLLSGTLTGVYDVWYVTGTGTGAILPPSNTAVAETPLPATLPLFASGLGAFAFVARRRRRKNVVALTA